MLASFALTCLKRRQRSHSMQGIWCIIAENGRAKRIRNIVCEKGACIWHQPQAPFVDRRVFRSLKNGSQRNLERVGNALEARWVAVCARFKRKNFLSCQSTGQGQLIDRIACRITG